MTHSVQPVYIVDIKRSPVGKAFKGAMAHYRPDNLLAHIIKETLANHPSLPLDLIEDVIVGCAMPEAEQGLNIARIVALLAGLPECVPGMTINRFCSSGLQSIAIAGDRIASGHADCILAGGVESMSMIPMTGNKLAANPKLFGADAAHIDIAYGMGITAEEVTQHYKINRDDQDAFALQSHQRALAAQQRGDFQSEIIPVTITQTRPNLSSGTIESHDTVLAADEGPRADTTLEALGKLRPAFAKDGSVTAGNSSQMSDGAGITILASERFCEQHNLTPMARFVGYDVAGVKPAIMGIGPIEAIPKALKKNGVHQNDLKWIELNEAFAAQSLAVIRDLELDTHIVNPLGGAIALGHPLGATGTIRTATLIHNLKQEGGGFGMVTMCIGTGMGAAGIFEVLG